MNTFVKRRALALAKQKIVSKTMHTIKPVSKGGTKLVTLDDVKLAAIELSRHVRKAQIQVSSIRQATWHAGLNGVD